MKQTVKTTDITTQYDERAKSLLGNKIILAHILAKTVDEFRGMKPEDVVPYIEGEPRIGEVPVEPGYTNIRTGQDEQKLPPSKQDRQKLSQTVKAIIRTSTDVSAKIVGLNTENAENNEGLIRFDLIFYVRMKDGLSQIIINLEAQKDEPTAYPILNRSVFYVSRMISSQKGRDFEGTDYHDIKQVYSIWICMNMKDDILDFIHLSKESLLEIYPWKGRLDLLNIVLIGISNTLPEPEEDKKLHYLLSALFSNRLTEAEKIEIIEKEYHIRIDNQVKEDVSIMCNLSQGILEQGISQGILVGKVEGKAQMLIMLGQEDGLDEATILQRLQEKAGLTLEQASAYFKQYGIF